MLRFVELLNRQLLKNFVMFHVIQISFQTPTVIEIYCIIHCRVKFLNLTPNLLSFHFGIKYMFSIQKLGRAVNQDIYLDAHSQTTMQSKTKEIRINR